MIQIEYRVLIKEKMGIFNDDFGYLMPSLSLILNAES